MKELKPLKPCPFCGGKASVNLLSHIVEYALYTVSCENTCSTHPYTVGMTLDEAENKRNTRASGWIPVSERLPNEDGKYLCCTKNGSIILAKYYHFGNGDRWSVFGSVAKSIVAWQPLPEAYKEDAE